MKNLPKGFHNAMPHAPEPHRFADLGAVVSGPETDIQRGQRIAREEQADRDLPGRIQRLRLDAMQAAWQAEQAIKAAKVRQRTGSWSPDSATTTSDANALDNAQRIARIHRRR